MNNLSSPLLLLLLLPIITINEIAWMGTEVSYNDEWIELKNNTENNINLDGWVLKAEDGSPEINLQGLISANGFYLLERTDDETIPGITADLIYKGALSNDGEHLKLYDNNASLANEVNCSDGWLAGDNAAKLTMQRVDDNWENSENPGGTPRTENVILSEAKNPEELPRDPSAKPQDDNKYPTGIIFKEIMPSPDGPDDENEWIKLYNQNNFEIDLSGWQIKDTIGKTTTYTLNAKIPGLEYLTLFRPDTKITLNNDGDGLKLFNPNKEIVDSVIFDKASQGHSYIKTSSGWQWKSEEIKKQEIKKEQIQKEEIIKTKENNIINLTSKQTNKPNPILIALIIAVFSGAMIVYLNNQLSEHSHSEHDTQNRF